MTLIDTSNLPSAPVPASAETFQLRTMDHRSCSSQCLFTRCPRLYCWRKQAGLDSVAPLRDLAMTFGSAIHAAAPATYPGALTTAMKEFGMVWGDNDKWEDKKRNSVTARRIIIAMCEAHTSGEYEPVRPEVLTPGEGEHETTFEVSLGLLSGKSVTGRVDCLIRRKSDSSLWIREYKTASVIWGSFKDIFTINVQIETYALALAVAGVKVSGALVEGILVAGGKTEIIPVPVELDQEKLDATLEWWKWQDRVLESLETYSSGVEDWPMNRTACTPYPMFGSQGFVCDFQPLCLAGPRWPGLLGMFSQAKRDSDVEVGNE